MSSSVPQPAQIRILVTGSGADRYGADEMLLRVAAGFDRSGFDVAVALPEGGPLNQALLSAGLSEIHEVPIPVLRRAVLRPSRLPRFILRLAASVSLARAFLREQRPSLVWVNTIVTPTWLIAARLERIPTVCHSHEITAASHVARRFMYLPLFCCAQIVAVSGAVMAEISSTYARLGARTTVMLNPSFEFRDGLPLPSSRSCDVVVIGRLSPRKGQHVMLEALRQMDEPDRPRVHLCGTPFRRYEWYERQLRSAIEDGNLPASLHGFVRREDAYKLGGIVVVPSTEPEACPLAVLEALAAGRAVVASSCGGIPEVAAGAAFMIPPRDPSALSRAVSQLLRLPDERRRLVAAGRERALELAPERYLCAITALAQSVSKRDAALPAAARPA